MTTEPTPFPDHSPSPRDRRTQRRILVRIPIQVQLPGVSRLLEAMNQDISWGGAQFVARCPLVEMSGPLRLILPWRGGESITIDGEVVRAQRLEDGHCQVAVRFVSVTPRSQARLEKLLAMLDSSAADDGQTALVSELELKVETAEVMRDILRQIDAGALTLTVTESYQVGQSIRLAIRGSDTLPRLRLRARVEAVEPVPVEGLVVADLQRLRLGFEHPRQALKQLAELLLGQMPEDKAHPDRDHSDEPEWLRNVMRARALDEAEAAPKPDGAGVCVLEARYPRAMDSLVAAWGDPDLFDVCFRELTIGDRAEPGGWPPDVWDELGLLQDVHDLAHGLPASRSSPLRPTRVR